MDRWTDRQVGRWMVNGWMDGRIDRWVDGWMGRWTDGQTAKVPMRTCLPIPTS